jgi:hypothetical protein
MNSEITYPAAITTLIGLGIVGAVIAGVQTSAASGQADPGSPAAIVAPQAKETTAIPASAPKIRPEALGSAATGFPYKGTTFTDFVKTSYQQDPDASRPGFFAWMQDSYAKSKVRFKGMEQVGDLDGVLAGIRERYEATNDPEARTLLEKQTGAFCHKLIKKTIKHFSLDNGFEFYNVVDKGQRQCFLQSTLIAGMMQRAGMRAGVVMVTRSDKGEESNNGHAVTLVKLSDGDDLLVDASHKTPFIKQQGLMVADTNGGVYRYVAPHYAADGDKIDGYAPMGAATTVVATTGVAPLSLDFIRSQFDYYRGERTPGGFFAKEKTTEGLNDSERFFTRAIQEDPGNPLPAYALGRVELRLGKTDEARRQFELAYQLYDRYGFVPQGETEALGLVHEPPQALTMR